jgi:YbbR domain-containing protein
MAFRIAKRREPDEARGVAAAWLRALLFEDWGLKLIALIITLGLWYAVTAARAPATSRQRDVPLEFFLPEGVEISNDPVDEVDAVLEGSQAKLSEINARDLVARVDVTQLGLGDRVVRLTDRNVTMDLPTGVRIVEIVPRSVTLRLEPVVEREVEVEARFEGNLPPGFTVRGVQITPPTVRVRGPESHVRAAERAYTETVSLEGRRESIMLPQTAVDIPDRKVTPLSASVVVRVEIAEEQAERRFTNVPVRTFEGGQPDPPTASLTLRGPRSLIESLRPEEVRLVLEPREGGQPEPRLSLPPSLAGRVELVSTTPAGFNLSP